ncbi:MAG: thiopurine S-methyltransferase [Alcaligenaceae bacterium]|nr:thiopurine S-methyltransferase [Alcaligenaceae bacterium]
MDTEFWLQRWREGHIGFHQDRVMPLLEKHWPALELPADSRVFVPLAGKSLDMIWLAGQGHRVLAVELSSLAIEQFFAENRLTPVEHDSPLGRHYVAGPIEMICGNVYDLSQTDLADCAGFYDRAALIALPAADRQRYASQVYGYLPKGCRGLMLTIDYPQDEMAGPPFSVTADEVRSLYEGRWAVTQIEERDILSKEPKFAERGLSRMSTGVYRLEAA